MTEVQPRPGTMTPEQLEAKIKLCEEAFRLYCQVKASRPAPRQVFSGESQLEDNPNIILGSD